VRTALATPRARSEARAAEAAALQALALVGLEHAADTPAPELTSSQRRLLALAAALATEPDVLLVDELAAGAGTEELEGLGAVVDRIRERGVAVLVVEHNLRLVRPGGRPRRRARRGNCPGRGFGRRGRCQWCGPAGLSWYATTVI